MRVPGDALLLAGGNGRPGARDHRRFGAARRRGRRHSKPESTSPSRSRLLTS